MKLNLIALYFGVVALFLFFTNDNDSLRYSALLVSGMFIVLGISEIKIENKKTRAFVFFGMAIVFLYVFVFFKKIIS